VFTRFCNGQTWILLLYLFCLLFTKSVAVCVLSLSFEPSGTDLAQWFPHRAASGEGLILGLVLIMQVKDSRCGTPPCRNACQDMGVLYVSGKNFHRQGTFLSLSKKLCAEPGLKTCRFRKQSPENSDLVLTSTFVGTVRAQHQHGLPSPVGQERLTG
jgi:hypothetical protein